MKYIVLLGDGMADEPIEALGGRTPLAAASTPVMDDLAGKGRMGMVCNVPTGMSPGSDVANLSVLGYNPRENYSGRSPLEALSVGVSMEPDDIIFRANIVTLSESEPYGEKIILDHSSGEISTADADILMDAIREAFNSEEIRFHTGTSYRHICVWKKGRAAELIPPHDHLGEPAGAYLPREPILREMMERSFDILNNHPLNLERAARGENKANSLWFWGAGTKPSIGSFFEKTGLKGTMISAVDLLKGIAVGAGMEVVEVPGANGSLHTNYEGKAAAAAKALLEDGNDFVYIHVEGPDEMGHQGSIEHKIQSIEWLDSRLLKPLKEAMDASGQPYRMLILPDHPTPIRIRTHTSDPVPYILYDSTREQKKISRYTEAEAAAAGPVLTEGWRLMDQLLHE
ncbi:MAG: cofactor-independent phosphoglycerate mutase [Oscillospiraceae bacterium]|nr:cofactor-independent phosphoglycerate mutase [Oscillospiraceae bacterium]